MKNVGIDCEIPPNQLRQGFGTPICVVLLSLVNKVIQKNNFAFKKPRLEEKKTSSKEEGLEIANKFGIKYFECSNKLNLNITEIMSNMIMDCYKNIKDDKKNKRTKLTEKGKKKKGKFC